MYSTTKLILQEYENVLLNNKSSISATLFPESSSLAEQEAYNLMQIVIEKFLHWTPQEAYLNFNKNIIDKMKLSDIVKYIRFPPEMIIDDEPDYSYIATNIYPDDCDYNFREAVIDLYKRLLANQYGEINEAKDSKDIQDLKRELQFDPYFKKAKENGRARYKFPKNYMSGTVGRMRAGLCLQYMIMTFFSFHSIDEMYSYFSNTQKAVNTLKKYRLDTVYETLFNSPLEFLHYSLPEESRNETLYNYYLFRNYTETHNSIQEFKSMYNEFSQHFVQ